MKSRKESTRNLCARVIKKVAPAWSLDGAVAVNPYWGFLEQDMPSVAAYLQTVNGERLFMPKRWYIEKLDSGELKLQDIVSAGNDLGFSDKPEDWQEWLRAPEQQLQSLQTLPEFYDRRGQIPMTEFVVEQISRFFAAWYDQGQAQWGFPKETADGLFAAWRRYTLHDRGLSTMDLGRLRHMLLGLSNEVEEAADWAREVLDLPPAVEEAYFLALFKSIGGWASWCRHLAWKAELAGNNNPDAAELLSISTVWEAALLRMAPTETISRWKQSISSWLHQDFETTRRQARRFEVLQCALEAASTRELGTRMAEQAPAAKNAEERPRVQAAFCIDVRSEVFRRHLENGMQGMQTMGYAGFFGIPLAYCRQGDEKTRSQTPVLLNPSVQAEEQLPADVTARRARRLRLSAIWKQFKLSATSCFTFVETAGITYAPRLLADTLGWHRPSIAPDDAGLTAKEGAQLQINLSSDLNLDSRAQMAASILEGLGLKTFVAPLVLLVGHGSSTTNNPHRAGLDCGACAGQTGEVNARAAAALLNDPQVREALAAYGHRLPVGCRFVPALHDTTTDEVRLLEDPAVDSSTADLLDELRARWRAPASWPAWKELCGWNRKRASKRHRACLIVDETGHRCALSGPWQGTPSSLPRRVSAPAI